MEETSEELPNFSIDIDLLGPYPTSNKNKAEKNSQVARFANLSADQLQCGGCPGENCQFPAVCLLQLHRALQRKNYFEQSRPLITSGL